MGIGGFGFVVAGVGVVLGRSLGALEGVAPGMDWRSDGREIEALRGRWGNERPWVGLGRRTE